MNREMIGKATELVWLAQGYQSIEGKSEEVCQMNKHKTSV